MNDTDELITNRAQIIVDKAFIRGSACEACVLNPHYAVPCVYHHSCPFDASTISSATFLTAAM